jgi:hypothetical protein
MADMSSVATSVATSQWVIMSNNGFGWYAIAGECQ